MRYRRLVGRYVTFAAVNQILPSGDLLSGAWGQVMVAPAYWRPAADVCETASEVTIVVELAGVDAEKVEVLLYEDAVVVTGERPLSPCAPEGVYHAAEIRHGPFRREVRLPCAVDADAVAARYERGLLQITLPKLAGHGGI